MKIMKKQKLLTERLIESALIGAVVGFIIIFVAGFFMNKCICYDDEGNYYGTTLFTVKNKGCSAQCKFFSEKESLNLTDEEPDFLKPELYIITNWSMVEVYPE